MIRGGRKNVIDAISHYLCCIKSPNTTGTDYIRSSGLRAITSTPWFIKSII